jgi:multidrug resistance efflux pump
VGRKWLIAGTASVILLIAGFLLRAHKPKPVTHISPVPAAPAPSETGDITLIGRVQPRTSVLVAAPLEGTLESFFVDIGQEVYKDQLLGKIRSANLDAAEQQAQLDLDKAETRVTTLSGDQLAARLEASRATVDQSRARADVDRLEKLYRQQKGLWDAGATPRLTFEKAEKDYNDAKAAIERVDTVAKLADSRAKTIESGIEDANRAVADRTAALERAKADLANAEIHSPADGIVMARRGQPGEPVNPSIQDLLQIGTELTALQVVLAVNSVQLARIHVGQAAGVRVPEITPDEIPATVSEIRGSDIVVNFTSPTPITKLDLAAQVRIKF